MAEPVVADPALRERLKTVADGRVVQLCDETGTVIGVAITLEQVRRFELEMAKLRVPKAELDRLASQPATYTTEDVLRMVEQS
ncbi:MAG: hypothetical protein C0501_22015 [Isosphaera sp.]|nr:hypothetical protein [Isosphaera sp.]